MDAEFDDLVLYNTVVFTSNYTPGYTLEDTKYLTTNVTLPEFEHTNPGALLTFDNFSTTETGSPKYTVQVGRSGNYLYWSGSAWVTSDGSYAQATDASTFATNAASLNIGEEDYLQFKVHFTDSNTQSNTNQLVATTTANTTYPTDNPIIAPQTCFLASELASFSTTQTAAGSNAVKHILSVDGQDKYWNGAAVVNSNGTYAQSNTVAEINDNIADFVTTRQAVCLKSFLHSDDGSTTPSLDVAQLSFTTALTDPTLPILTPLQGFIYDNNTALSGEAILIRPYQLGFQNEGIVHKYEWKTLGTTDSEGWFEGAVFAQPRNKYWELKIGKKRYKIQLTAGQTNDLSEIPYELVED
jgi:hypothetical protein